MFGYYYGFDLTYLVLVLPCVIFSIITSVAVNTTFKKYSQQFSRSGITGAEAARQVLLSHGVNNVQIEHVSGNLTDHYDPRTNIIRLSDNVYHNSSTAAIGVACHEAGHAVQHAQNFFPNKVRTAIFPIANIGSKLAFPLILLGVAFTFFEDYSYIFIYTGIACFGFSFLFQLITLPVELNASARALSAIKSCQMLSGNEIDGARKTLRAAALTYVAAAAVSLAQLLRLILLFGRRRND